MAAPPAKSQANRGLGRSKELEPGRMVQLRDCSALLFPADKDSKAVSTDSKQKPRRKKQHHTTELR